MVEIGSIEWQEEQEKRILRKLKRKQKLNKADRVFIAIQMMHNKRIGKLLRLAG